MKRFLFSWVLLAACVSVLLAAPPSADEVLRDAKAKAASEHKAIFVHFGASWCVWCKHLDQFLEKTEVKPVFEKYFVPVKLVVHENDKNKSLENAGADDLEKKWGGPAGLPYSAFLSADATLIADSKMDGNNIGYPAAPEEIAFFLKLMKRAAPTMTAEDAKVIETALRSFKR